MANTNETVHLRKRQRTHGGYSLYLDIYANGRRNYEYLKLYLVPENSRADKLKNQETMRLAEAVKAQRIVEIQNGRFGFDTPKMSKINLFAYWDEVMERRKKADSTGNYGNWYSAKTHLLKYAGTGDVKMADIDKKFCQGFKDYLRTTETKSGKPLSQNSRNSYFIKFRVFMQTALDEGIININPCSGIKPDKPSEEKREYLTIDEIKQLSKTPCTKDVLKRAFLFSCLTGLRWSDVNKLTWGDVRQQDGFRRIVFRQKKTKNLEYLDINPQAAALMGTPSDDNDRIFRGLKYSAQMNIELQRWCMTAGISKKITFHCGRHTFAVMMLTLGTEIYTVQKLLGHRELKTTQIYADILDKKKQDAVTQIPQVL